MADLHVSTLNICDDGIIGGAAPASNSTKHPPLYFSCVIFLEQMSEPAEFIHVVLLPVLMGSFLSCDGVPTFALTSKPKMEAGRAFTAFLTMVRRRREAWQPRGRA